MYSDLLFLHVNIILLMNNKFINNLAYKTERIKIDNTNLTYDVYSIL